MAGHEHLEAQGDLLHLDGFDVFPAEPFRPGGGPVQATVLKKLAGCVVPEHPGSIVAVILYHSVSFSLTPTLPKTL